MLYTTTALNSKKTFSSPNIDLANEIIFIKNKIHKNITAVEIYPPPKYDPFLILLSRKKTIPSIIMTPSASSMMMYTALFKFTNAAVNTKNNNAVVMNLFMVIFTILIYSNVRS